MEEVLREKGIYISTTVGNSMYPMLRNRRDVVIIQPVIEKPGKYDILLYRRGKDYVLHRIVKVMPAGYVICGDNCLNKEYQVKDCQIIGVLRGFYRDDREVDMNSAGYRLYCRFWVSVYPARYVIKKVWITAKALVMRMGKWTLK